MLGAMLALMHEMIAASAVTSFILSRDCRELYMPAAAHFEWLV
eukprot:SAG31_NODE_795_length_12036_cov_28.879953_7_plen_43_part_00